MVDRFLRLAALEDSVQHLVDWGETGRDCIGFSTAIEIARFPRTEHSAVGLLAVRHQLTKQEVLSVRQLTERSSESVAEAVERIVARRPVAREVAVIMGAVTDPKLQQELASVTQHQRNSMLKAVIIEVAPTDEEFSARLGTSHYTLIGTVKFARTFERMHDPEQIIAERLQNALRASGEQ